MNPGSKGHRLRLGVIGTGAMASKMTQAAQYASGISVSAVLSRNAERGARFCEAVAVGATAYVDVQRFFDSVDTVYIATPAATHGKFIEMAIEAGKPILCEKPLTVSSQETRRLLSRARSANVLLMEAIWTLALPAYRELHASFSGRENAVLQFDFSYPVAALPGDHVLDPQYGGVLLDRAVYGYAAAIFLLGEVASQTVWVTRNEVGVDTSAEMRLQHADGAKSIITLSFERLGPNHLFVSDATAMFELGPTSVVAETLKRFERPTPFKGNLETEKPGIKSKLKAAPLLRYIKARLPEKSRFLSFGASPYLPILQDFLATIEEGRLESETVPHMFSEQIASLTEHATHQRDIC